MATSENCAQDVVLCDLCDKPTQQFCNSCQVSLCDDCVGKHRDEFQSLSHEIVPFLDRKIQLAFPECQEHPGQRCEAHCQQCLKPVCIKCFLGSHKGHDAEELIKVHEHRLQEIQEDTTEIDKIIPRYQKENDDVNFAISKIHDKFENFSKDIKNQRHLWHREVDNIFDNIDLLSGSQKKKNLDALQTHQKKIKTLISEMIQDAEQNKRIMKSNKLSEVSSFQSKSMKFRKVPEKIDAKMPSSNKKMDRGKELSISIEDLKATLTQTSPPSLETDVYYLTTALAELMMEARVVFVIPTSYKAQNNIACVGDTEAWVSTDNKTIIRVDLHGTVKDTLITHTFGMRLFSFMLHTPTSNIFLSRPVDISVTKDGNLVYSNRSNGTVDIVSSGSIKSLISIPVISTPLSLNPVPLSLCCTNSGDLLVHVMRYNVLKEKHEIIRYNGQGESEVIYNLTMDGLRTIHMTENSNGDVCVSAADAKTVAVLDRTGEIRFQYEGTMTMRKDSFDPRGIVTDSLCQIIVSDHNNDCLHILDQNGQFLKFIEGYGLSKPYGLSIDNMDRLWVGLCDSGEIKVIEYLNQTNKNQSAL